MPAGLPSTSRLACIVAPGGPFEVISRPIPDLEPGAVLMRTLYSEVCGTDCHLFHGKLEGVPYPLTPGHVNVGEVAAVRGLVKTVDGLPVEPGQILTFLDVHETCGDCWFCLVAKTPTRCPHRRVYGITYGTDEGLLGGWSEFIYLKPGVKLLALPAGLSPKAFIATGCGMPTGFRAVERAEIRLGDCVAVQGSGPVGLAALAFARLSGAGRLLMLGAPEARLEMGRQFGADCLIDIRPLSGQERVAAVLAETGGRGADVVIEASGSPDAVPEGLEMIRDGGRYVVAGQYTDNGDTAINPHRHLTRKHVDLRGCWGAEFSHLYRGAAMMARAAESFPWEAMITGVYGLDECQMALDAVARLGEVKAVINPWKQQSTP